MSNSADPKNILTELVTAIANTLEVDRCFLYIRDPQTRLGQVAACYCRNLQVPDVSSNQWKVETEIEAMETMVIQMTPLVQQYVQKNISGVGK